MSSIQDNPRTSPERRGPANSDFDGVLRVVLTTAYKLY